MRCCCALIRVLDCDDDSNFTSDLLLEDQAHTCVHLKNTEKVQLITLVVWLRVVACLRKNIMFLVAVHGCVPILGLHPFKSVSSIF